MSIPPDQYRLPAQQRFGPGAAELRLLCLSGGGYRGLFIAQILARIEERLLAGEPIGAHFGMFAGTSVGGLIALALTCGRRASEVRDALIEHAPRIFPAHPLGRLRKLFGPPYDPARLADAVRACVGAEHANRPLDSIERPLLVTSVSWTRGCLAPLRSAGLAGALADEATVMDAALATAAAPAHFPAHPVAGDPRLDGGLCANAPDAIALLEAVQRLRLPFEELRVMSVGTAAPPTGAMPAAVPVWGLGWSRYLIPLAIAGQERSTVQACKSLLGDRYLRVDQVPAPGLRTLGEFDRVDASRTGALLALADAAFEDLMDRRRNALDPFLR